MLRKIGNTGVSGIEFRIEAIHYGGCILWWILALGMQPWSRVMQARVCECDKLPVQLYPAAVTLKLL